jgi:hypothetical protein
LFIPLLVVALGAAACDWQESPEPPGAAPGDAIGRAAADPAMERTAECVNRAEGYAVEYPAAWHVNTEEIFGPCSLFDPDPIEVPPASELPLEIAIQIGFEPVPFATLTGDVLGRRNLSRERTTVDGREAMRIEGETTGEGLHDRGIRSYQYFVDLGDTTLVASTYDVGSLPFERKRSILDAMMATFDFREPSPLRALDPGLAPDGRVHLLQHPVQRRAIMDLPAPDDGVDALGVADVLKRVGIQDHQLGALAGFHGAQGVLQPEELGGTEGRAAQRLQRRQPGLGDQ